MNSGDQDYDPVSSSIFSARKSHHKELDRITSSTPDTSILDLPPEVLDYIFDYLQLNLASLLELALVCRQFRSAAYRQSIPVKIPLLDQALQVIVTHQIPVSMLCNREPALFVKYQIGQLNLRRLNSAQLVASDYLAKSNNVQLSPFYIEICLNNFIKCKLPKFTF